LLISLKSAHKKQLAQEVVLVVSSVMHPQLLGNAVSVS